MAKKIVAQVKLQIPAGAATPAPPVGTALGPQGVNIMEFCKAFNARTKDGGGILTPVVVTVYSDKTFTFVTKTPPTSVLILKELGKDKGSGTPNKDKIGELTIEQVKKIAQMKMPDLTAGSLEAAMKTVIGTAKNMGVTIKE